MNRKLIYINFGVIALLAIGLLFFIFQNQKILNSLAPNEPQNQETIETKNEHTKASSQSAQPNPKQITAEDTQKAILDFTNNTNRTGLNQFMTDKVSVVIYASDCCQPMSTEEAIKQLNYINEGLPITFDQKNTTIVSLRAKNPTLANTYLGISQTKEHMAAYTIDEKTNKITKIELSVSWKLYNQ